MAIDRRVEVALDAPPVAVFEALTDLDRWPEWLIASGIVRVTRVDPSGPVAAGSALRIEQRVAGRATTLDARVTALATPEHFGVAGRDPDGVTVGIDAHLAPRDARTTLTWHLRITVPLRYRLFESMAAPQVERAVRLDLEAFRRRLSTGAATGD